MGGWGSKDLWTGPTRECGRALSAGCVCRLYAKCLALRGDHVDGGGGCPLGTLKELLGRPGEGEASTKPCPLGEAWELEQAGREGRAARAMATAAATASHSSGDLPTGQPEEERGVFSSSPTPHLPL